MNKTHSHKSFFYGAENVPILCHVLLRAVHSQPCVCFISLQNCLNFHSGKCVLCVVQWIICTKSNGLTHGNV